jgi:MarR family transcriptional regulator, lower aerobic nicotinate degradation pathway regulator
MAVIPGQSAMSYGSLRWCYQSMDYPVVRAKVLQVRAERQDRWAATPSALQHRQTYQLARLAALGREFCAERLASLGLRQQQHAILCCLAEFGPECQSDVAARLGIDSGDMVGLVDALQRAGLVARQRDERDRRLQILTLTPDGRRVLRRADKLLDQAATAMFEPLDAIESGELRRLMLRVLAYHEPGAWP